MVCKSVKKKDEAVSDIPESDFPGGEKLKYSISGVAVQDRVDVLGFFFVCFGSVG
jgi:hypothetical protein